MHAATLMNRWWRAAISALVILHTASVGPRPANAQQVVANGTTQTATGTIDTGVTPITGGYALYALNGGIINSFSPLILITGAADAQAARAESGGQITIFDGSSAKTTGSQASALFAFLSNATITATNTTISTSGQFSRGAEANVAGHIVLNGGLVTTTGAFAEGLFTIDENATLKATGTTVQTAGPDAHGANALLGNIALEGVAITTGGDRAIGAVADNASTLSMLGGSAKTSGASAFGLLSTSGSVLTGQNVAISTSGTSGIGASAQFGGQVILNGGSITTTGASATGLFSVGLLGVQAIPAIPTTVVLPDDPALPAAGPTGAQIMATGVTVTTSGMNAHGAAVRGASKLALKDSTVTVTGAGASALFSSAFDSGASIASIESSTLTSAQGAGIRVVGTTLNATLTGSSLAGGGNLLEVVANSGSGAPGVLNLTADASVLTGAAFTEVGSTSNVILQKGTVWNLTGDSNVTSLTNDASSILFTPPVGGVFKTLTAVTYVGANGTLGLNTLLGADGSPSDKLAIRDGAVPGSATGFTTMLVANAGGLGAQTVANGILVVDAQSTTAPGAFALGKAAVAGPYEYLLFRGSVDASAPESWFLRSTLDCALPGAPSPPCPAPPPGPGPAPPGPGPAPPGPPVPNFRQEVSLYAALPALALLYGRSLMDTLHERVGEEEHLRGRTDLLGSPYVNGAWGRVIAQSGNRDGDRAGVFGDGPKFDFDFTAIQAGVDVYRGQFAGYRTHAGFYGALGDGRSDVTHFTGVKGGRDRFAAYTAGGYVTLFGPTGWYLDSIAQGTFYDMKGQSTRFPALETDGRGFAASLEAGYPFRGLLGGWTVEPQGQLVYQNVNLDNASDIAAQVRFDDIESLAGRLGVRFATTWAVPPGFWGVPQPALMTAWFRPNYWHEFSGDPRTLFSSETGFIPFRADLGEDWVELNTGISARIDRATELYANASYQFGVNGDSDAWGGKIGLRVNW